MKGKEGKGPTRLHHGYALTGKVPKISTGGSEIHPRYAKGGKVKKPRGRG